MTDQQILNNIDFIHEPGLGRGGFRIYLSSWQVYDDNLILNSFGGRYVNPVGPFHKYVEISASIYSAEKEYRLLFRNEFWKTCTEQECLEQYIHPFVCLLRRFVNGEVDTRIIRSDFIGYRAYEKGHETEIKESFPDWLKYLRRVELK